MIRNKSQAVEAARFLRDHFEHDPEIALLTGTGLGDSTESLEIQTAIHYRDIPHFPISTVESHAGKLIFGRLKNRHVVSFQGRCHLYEGYSPSAVTFPVRVMRELGVNLLILSNAAGGMNTAFPATLGQEGNGNRSVGTNGLSNRVVWGLGMNFTPAMEDRLTAGVQFWDFRFQRIDASNGAHIISGNSTGYPTV